MMEYIKEKLPTVKNMESANIILRMEIYTRDKCTRVWCKEKENIHGQTKTYLRGLLLLIKCVAQASSYLPTGMSTKDNL